MKGLSKWMTGAILFLCAPAICCIGCKGAGTDVRQVAGALDGPLPADSAPARVLQAMEKAERYRQFEIMTDTAASISVEAIAEADTTSTEGYGIVVTKGASSTTFPNLRNVRINMAAYDRMGSTLWLTCSVMWGTGVQVDRLYQIRFDGEGKAGIAHTIEPYDVQQTMQERLGYSIAGEQVTFYNGKRMLTTATNTISDMGGFDDENPVWIGEQITYDLSGDVPCLLVTPCLAFTTGMPLIYDDMPTFSAPVSISESGQVNIGELSLYHPK